MLRIWRNFYRKKLGMIALGLIIAFALVGIYAPFLAASKPILVRYENVWYFPLFRYLFFRGYYTKSIDLFFNLFMFILPFIVIACCLLKKHVRMGVVALFMLFQVIGYGWLMSGPIRDPGYYRAADPGETWGRELAAMSPYARLNLALGWKLGVDYNRRLSSRYHNPPTPFMRQQMLFAAQIQRLGDRKDEEAQARLTYLNDKQQWLEDQVLDYCWMPFFRSFHWEEDAGGDRDFNAQARWYERTRVNRKDLLSSLIFGIRVSLMVGFAAVFLCMIIGIPLGAYAGYYGGRLDLVLSRFTEIWESMPTFFMLLMTVAILQQKSLFLIILVMGLFGWTTYFRFIRAEVLKQRNLTYVEACLCQGMRDRWILFRHILPNALPPILTLLPFSIMNAITREAALSFLGLGEEGSTSWGVLMDEGRSVFPAESYLLWPPAILLSVLLVAVALLGDSLRDALDPRLEHS